MRPALSDTIEQFPDTGVAYLNNASTSRMPLLCIRAMEDFLVDYNRVGPDSKKSAELVDGEALRVRKAVSRMLHCQIDEIALTQSTTDGINIVAGGLTVGPKSNVVIRSVSHEHHANVYPWLWMAATPRTLTIDKNGFFDIEQLRSVLDGDTVVVAMSHGLYNTGALLPLEDVGRVVGDTAPFFVDAAQTVGSIGDYDFSRLGSDFMAFNGSKWLCGPMGTGLFYCSRKMASAIRPTRVGGESALMHDGLNLAMMEMPDRFQAGYRNYVGLAGLAASLEYVMSLGLDSIVRHNNMLCDALRDALTEIKGVRLYGPDDDRCVSIVSFTIKGHKSKDVVSKLEAEGVVVALREIEDVKTIRVSPHFYNTSAEIESLVDTIIKIVC